MHSGSLLCSIRAAVFMVSPKRQNLKFLVPTMPLMHDPVWMPTLSSGATSAGGATTRPEALMIALAYPIILSVLWTSALFSLTPLLKSKASSSSSPACCLCILPVTTPTAATYWSPTVSTL